MIEGWERTNLSPQRCVIMKDDVRQMALAAYWSLDLWVRNIKWCIQLLEKNKLKK